MPAWSCRSAPACIIINEEAQDPAKKFQKGAPVCCTIAAALMYCNLVNVCCTTAAALMYCTTAAALMYCNLVNYEQECQNILNKTPFLRPSWPLGRSRSTLNMRSKGHMPFPMSGQLQCLSYLSSFVRCSQSEYAWPWPWHLKCVKVKCKCLSKAIVELSLWW